MRRRLTPLSAVLLTLAAIGLLTYMIRQPGWFIIPVVVFGLVYLLYKYPPGRVRRREYRAPRPAARDRRKSGAAPRRKPLPFKVIEGGRDDDDDEDRPRYH